MPAYRPGQGLSGHAVDRLKARVQAQSGAFTLPCQDVSKQWDHLLGEGATKKTRCSICTRPLGGEKDALGVSVCALCDVPLAENNVSGNRGSAASRRSRGNGRATDIVCSKAVSKCSECVVPRLTSLPVEPPQAYDLTKETKNGMVGERCNKAASSVGSTADPEEAENDSWDKWLDSEMATPDVQPASAVASCRALPPSIGSQQHVLGTCKPCAFVCKGGCANGPACVFCHLCPPRIKQQRKKERKCGVQNNQQRLVPGNNGNANVSEETPAANAAQTVGTRNTQSLANPWGAPTPTAPSSQQAAISALASNPMAGMMQTMHAQSYGGMGAPATGTNPRDSMMQHMMQNPAMPQQGTQMAQQLFGGSVGGANWDTTAMMNPVAALMQQTNTQSNDGAVAFPGGTGGNPMQPIMEQMMQNPIMMQQNMQMPQQMFGVGLGGNNTEANTNPMAARMQQRMNPPTSAAAPVSAKASIAVEGQEPAAAITNTSNPVMPTDGMPGANPGVNPMHAIMQQRMQAFMTNPELLAQRQAQARAMFGGGYFEFQMSPFAPTAQPFAGGIPQGPSCFV